VYCALSEAGLGKQRMADIGYVSVLALRLFQVMRPHGQWCFQLTAPSKFDFVSWRSGLVCKSRLNENIVHEQ